MMRKNERSLDVYKKAGAQMRLFKQLGTSLACDISKVLSVGDTDMLLRALDKVDIVCSRAEDNMFSDHPYLDDKYVDVFYGNLRNEPRNEVDAEIAEMAKDTADGLFK